MKFDQNHCTIVQGLLSDFGVTLKNHKKTKFDRNQLKLSTQHKYMYMYQEKLLKWRILYLSILVKFDKNHCTIVQGLLSDFGATLKNHKKTKFDWNQLKLSTQYKYMYMYQEKLLKWRILYLSILVKFDKNHCTIVQGLLSDFGATLKNHKKSKFDWNQLKLSTQHKYMYMYQKM